MGKYIDADRLRVEIEQRLDKLNPKVGMFGDRPLRAVNPKTFPRESELEKVLGLIDSLQQEQPEVQNEKFVFPKYLYARTKDNKTIDMSYAPQDMTAVEYIRNDFVEQEQPMPDSTKLIELWHEDKEMLKEKDFRNDPWRLAYNAYMCGFGRGIAVNKQEQPNNMIQWTGNNLKEVIDFTGKSPRFGEWFNSWKDYENYVHTHNGILKLFCEDGSHYEVPIGAWIVKTPDGYNLPSVAKYIQQEKPEVDLEQFDKDVTKIWGRCAAEPNDSIACLHIETFNEVASHFYELGLNARKV